MNHIWLFDVLHLAIHPNAFGNDCGGYINALRPSSNVVSPIVQYISVRNSFFLSIFNFNISFFFSIDLFYYTKDRAIQSMTVVAGEKVAMGMLVREI